MTKLFYCALMAFDLATFTAPFLAPTIFYYPPLIWVVFVVWPSIILAAIYEAEKKK